MSLKREENVVTSQNDHKAVDFDYFSSNWSAWKEEKVARFLRNAWSQEGGGMALKSTSQVRNLVN